MIVWKDLTSSEVPLVDHRLPVLIPVGLVEAHGPHLGLSLDYDTAEWFARRIAQETGAILAPTLPYGFADEMAEYQGTIGLRVDTAVAVFTDIISHFCQHGFRNVILVSGHGANQVAFNVAIHRVWERHPAAQVAYWNYWTEAGYTKISHADQGETEIALVVGTRATMTLAKDYQVQKPWYRIRSRAALCPDTGGINGAPTKATREAGERVCEDIVRILADKLRAIMRTEMAS